MKILSMVKFIYISSLEIIYAVILSISLFFVHIRMFSFFRHCRHRGFPGNTLNEAITGANLICGLIFSCPWREGPRKHVALFLINA